LATATSYFCPHWKISPDGRPGPSADHTPLGWAKGEEEMIGHPTKAYINFDAPAALRKWPSLRGERRTEGTSSYLIVYDTLDVCIRMFAAKPPSLRHLYEIQTLPQPPLISSVLTGDHVVELARLRDFL
jgi:hypothetical protein